MLLAWLTLFFQIETQACGYQYVSDCATTADLNVNGLTSGFQVSNCPYLTVFHNHDFGVVTSLSISELKSISWESCDNFVMNARFFYRVYPQSSSGGAFTQVNLTQLSTIAAGAYRTRTREEFANIDLLDGLNSGAYFIEVYYESDVDFDNDGTPDDLITKNNGGSYFRASFTVDNGQTGTLNVLLSQKTNVSCSGGADGTATVNVTNGTSPYAYYWSNGATGASATGLTAGNYTVTATDASGEEGTLIVSISQPSPLQANVSGQDETSSSANNGSATAAPTGGVPSFSYLWSNGATTAAITGLDSGAYSVTVTDGNGCTAIGSVVIAVSGTNPTNYCDSKGDFPWVDWITNVKIADIDHASGKSQYSDFTSVSTQLNIGANYSLTLENGYSWNTFEEYWKVWIDYNRNGTFEEPGEVAFSGLLPAPPLGTPGGVTTGTVSVPPSADEGLTRMRVAVKRDGFASPCETIPFGEVEDYTVNLVNGGPVPCSISASVGSLLCNDSGTDADPSDDTFTFALSANGNGTGATWQTIIDGQTFTGSYGSAAVLGPFDISGGALNFAVADVDDPTCTTTLDVVPPATCSTTTPCTISANAGNPICNDNSTPSDPSDDTYTFNLTVTGSNTGPGWTTSILGAPQSGGYGSTTLMGPYPIAGGDLSFTLADVDDSGCTAAVSVTAPSPCSNGGNGQDYCESVSAFPWHDWVAGVVFENVANPSGKMAYSDFTGLSANVTQGQSYGIDLTAGFSWFTYEEHWHVWIDFDQNGTFEASELALSLTEPAPPNGTLEHTVSGTLSIPATALTGPTRMRISMKRDADPTPCENIPNGEVEDYTVNISASLGGGGSNLLLNSETLLDDIELHALLEVTPEAAGWQLEKSADGEHFEFLAAGQLTGEEGDTALRQMDAQPFEGKNVYRLSLLDREGSVISEELTQGQFEHVAKFEIFPNPTTSDCQLELSKLQGWNVRIEVYDQQGHSVHREILPEVNEAFHHLPLGHLRDGMYLVVVHPEDRRPISKKLIISRL